MSDFTIKPPGAPTTDRVATPLGERGVGREDGVGRGEGAKPFELSSGAAATPEAGAPSPAAPLEPSALVQRIRTGELDVDGAVEILVDQALAAQPGASETLRQEVRRALIELVRDDPTLAALASAMRR